MKEKEDNPQHRIPFRLNDEELEFLDDFSKSTGIYRSYVLINFIRKIQYGVSIVKTDQLLKVLAALAAEQGRVNNNINQLAKHANQLLCGCLSLSFNAGNGMSGSDPSD